MTGGTDPPGERVVQALDRFENRMMLAFDRFERRVFWGVAAMWMAFCVALYFILHCALRGA